MFSVPCNCHYLHRLCEHHRSAGLYTAYKRLECYRRTCDHEHCACGGCRNKSKRNKGLAEKLCQTCGDNRSAECNGACYQTAVALYATFRKRACVLIIAGLIDAVCPIVIPLAFSAYFDISTASFRHMFSCSSRPCS